MTHRFLLRAAIAAIVVTINPLAAPQELPAQTVIRWPEGSIALGGANRAVLGVTLASASRGDTLGVRVEDVNADGPAAKAGVKAGMIITAIDGVSLRVNADDAADNELMGLAQRRLTRTLAKAKPGDEVELRVLDGRDARIMRVKTVSAAELAREPVRATATARASAAGSRPALGLSIGVTGNPRDTLGLFVNSVVANGPAEKAGIIEGDRVAAINGIDLRVPKEDLEDTPARMARVTRFNREIQKLTAGDKVTLRVYNSGRFREVSVASVKASDLPTRGFQMHIGDGAFFMNAPEMRRVVPGAEFPAGAFNLAMPPVNVEIDPEVREKLEQSMIELRSRLQELPARIRTEVAPRFRIETESQPRTLRPATRTITRTTAI